MEIYLVGGAVRDELLGKTPKDRDYVVVGATPEEMLSLGYQQVGNTFSVFLHPETKEEYSLIRGGDLQEDLERRDLTINAMARASDGKLIDPFGGQKDIEHKTLRHVSKAFEEDPLRVMRVARFKAQNPEFTVAPETIEFMGEIARTQAYASLLPERVFGELRLALQSKAPSDFFEVLKYVGALKPFFPELSALIGVPQNPLYHPEGDAWTHTMLVLDQAANLSGNILVRYAALVHDLGKGVTPEHVLPRHVGHEDSGVPLVRALGQRLRLPVDWTEAGEVVTRFHLRVHRLHEMKPKTIVKMFYEMDAFRRPDLVEVLARACEADELGKHRNDVQEGKRLEELFGVVRGVSFKDISPGLKGKEVGEAIRSLRVLKLSEYLHL